MQYENYMNSKSWEKRRFRWFTKHGKWCRNCKTERKIHLHHITYARMGQELDADLIALCEKCHSLLHQYQRDSGHTVEEATAVFMALSKAADEYLDKPKKKGKKAAKPKAKKRYYPKSYKKEKSEFIPLNKRPGYESPYERHSIETTSYAMQKERRLSGLPIVRIVRPK